MLPRDDNRHAADPRSGERGYSLIELMVVAALLLVVLGAILTLAETTQRIAPKETERAHVIREAQVGLYRMTRELRHAYSAPAVTPSTIQATVLGTGGVTRTVSYECNHAHPTTSGWTQCKRFLVNGSVKTGGEVIVDRVLNGSSVFTLTPPDYVRAAVEVAARGDRQTGHTHRVILDDGFYMRNLDG